MEASEIHSRACITRAGQRLKVAGQRRSALVKGPLRESNRSYGGSKGSAVYKGIKQLIWRVQQLGKGPKSSSGGFIGVQKGSGTHFDQF